MGYLDFTNADLFALTRERRRELLAALYCREPVDHEAVARAFQRVHGRPLAPPPVRVSAQHRSAEFKIKIALVGGTRRKSSYKAWRHLQFHMGWRNCYYCDVRMILGPRAPNSATVDHKTPLSRDGADNPSNWCMCCWTCNNRKGSLNEAEFRAVRAREAAAVVMPFPGSCEAA